MALSAIATAVIATISCAEPRTDFRDFFALHYLRGPVGQWYAQRTDTVQMGFERFAEAIDDYSDYVAARVEKCGAQK